MKPKALYYKYSLIYLLWRDEITSYPCCSDDDGWIGYLKIKHRPKSNSFELDMSHLYSIISDNNYITASAWIKFIEESRFYIPSFKYWENI